MNFLFRDYPKARVVNKTLLYFLITLLIPLTMVYININSNQIPNYTEKILANKDLTSLITNRIVEESKKNVALTDQNAVIDNAGKLNLAIEELLSDPVIKDGVNQASEQIFNFYLKNSNQPNIDLSPIVNKVYEKILPIDPKFETLLPAKSTLQTLSLPVNDQTANIIKYKDYLKIAFYLILLLILLLTFLLLITSESLNLFLRSIGVLLFTVGSEIMVATFAVKQVASIFSDSNSDALIKGLIKVIVDTAMGKYLVVGAIPAISGIIFYGLYRIRLMLEYRSIS